MTMRRKFCLTLLIALMPGLFPLVTSARDTLPEGFEPAEYIPDNPAPQLPPGVSRDDILWHDGCYYILQGGQPVLLPFTETNPATGAVSHYDRYCLG